MVGIPRILGCTLLLVATNIFAATDEAKSFGGCLEGSASYREHGDIRHSIDLLNEAQRLAGSEVEHARLNTELGATLIQARQFDDAERHLKSAYAFHTGIEHARDAQQLGNLAIKRKQPSQAQLYYQEAKDLAVRDAPLRISATLNLARLQKGQERIATLTTLSDEIVKDITVPALRARFQVNLAAQAQVSGAIDLAYRNLDAARTTLLASGNSRLLVETFNALAQLYEDQGRLADASLLNVEGLALASRLNLREVAELGVFMEWRQGRLFRQSGRMDEALVAYQRAADQLEKIRQALPIEYEDGRSTYGATIEPLYLGLIELLLSRADGLPPETQTNFLRQARDMIELTRQAEMQDFLGDRCSVTNVESIGTVSRLPTGTSVLYIVILTDHVELLLETPNGFERQHVEVDAKTLRAKAKAFAEQLRFGEPDYLANAQRLYDWLVRPIENRLAASQTGTLVVVPNGTLRLVAMAALHDGKQFLIEKYALASATGMSMTQTDAPRHGKVISLVAGLSEPGPVVDKLPNLAVGKILEPAASRSVTSRRITDTLPTMRSFHTGIAKRGAASAEAGRTASDALKQSLALPGVTEEVKAIVQALNSNRLLNDEFTLGRFRREAETGGYRIIHIASHGVFGGDAESSFILAYDDLLTLNGLQALLKSENFRKNPIEILTLSACQTAEGNERAPLGISGAAIKARARSVLGTLWPVEDESARTLMERFYVGLVKHGLSKGEALRQAQVSLLKNPDFAHPLFWAPFTLIGNWQ